MVRAFDLSEAEKFGELVILLPPGRIMLTPKKAKAMLRKGVKDFMNDDYLLLVGDQGAASLMCVVAAEMNRGRYTYLQWDRFMSEYIEVTVE